MLAARESSPSEVAASEKSRRFIERILLLVRQTEPARGGEFPRTWRARGDEWWRQMPRGEA
jgi:hypothetical protein